jgi:hypothetical protein
MTTQAWLAGFGFGERLQFDRGGAKGIAFQLPRQFPEYMSKRCRYRPP